MKNSRVLSFLGVFLFAVSALCASAPVANAQKIGDVAKFDDKFYMFVNEFKTPEQNDLFNHNIGIMQRYAAALRDLQAKVKAEPDERKKEELQTKLSALENEFKANDNAMRKSYAFASDRKYRMVFLSSNICTALDKEELSSLKTSDGVQMDPMKIIQKGGTNYYRLKSINGIPDNLELQKNLNAVMAYKMQVDDLRSKIAGTVDANQQLELTKKLSDTEMAMKQHDAKVREKYGIHPKKNYIVEIGHSQLWIELTPQEAALVMQQKKANAASGNGKQGN